jgi:hypothetical protein
MGTEVLRRVLVAPLGELPGEKELVELAASLREEERYRPGRRLFTGGRKKDAELLRKALEEVRAREGVLLAQKNGERKGIEEPLGRERAVVSVLCLAGVHGERSVYVLRFERWKVRQGDPVPSLTWLLGEALKGSPEARRQLEFLRAELQEHHPALRHLEEKGLPVVRAEAWGHVVLFLDPLGEAVYVGVGRTVVPLPHVGITPVDLETEGASRVRWLREHTPLGHLPPKKVRALLRGKGDVEEAERVLALLRLSEY